MVGTRGGHSDRMSVGVGLCLADSTRSCVYSNMASLLHYLLTIPCRVLDSSTSV